MSKMHVIPIPIGICVDLIEYSMSTGERELAREVS